MSIFQNSNFKLYYVSYTYSLVFIISSVISINKQSNFTNKIKYSNSNLKEGRIVEEERIVGTSVGLNLINH